MSRYFEAEVVRVDSLLPHVVAPVIRRSDGEPFSLRAGQFFMMHFEVEGAKTNRSYSVAQPIADSTQQEAELCIALIEGGVGSQRVAAWEPGDTFRASGPHGRFILRPGETDDLVLVATGTGVAPFRAMVPGLEERMKSGNRVTLVYGARTEDQFLYDEEWRRLEHEYDGFRYLPCASRPRDEEACKVVGRVQRGIEPLLDEEVPPMFYLCGNPEMVEDVKQLLAERGVDRRRVRTESYTSPD